MNIKLSLFLWVCIVFLGKVCLPVEPVMALATGTISIAHVMAEPDTQVDVPVVVTGFQNFDVFQFSFQFDSDAAEYVDIVEPHSSLAGQTFLTGTDGNNISVTFFGSGSGHSIPNGEVLFKLRFIFCADPMACALNGSVAEIIFDMTGQNYLAKPDFSSITLTYNDGSIYADQTFHILTVNLNGEGSVGVDGTPYTEPLIAESGTSLELLASPAAGWLFNGWSGDLSGTANPSTILLDDNKNITATFIEEILITHTITASAGPNGSIAPAGEVTVDKGSSQGFTITPNNGYHIADVLVNGSSVGTPAEYTFTNVTDNHTIQTTFAINTYTIAASASPAAGGTVSGAGTYTHGEEVILTATANEGYEFVYWTENGTVVSSSAEYIFDASDSRSLLAVFETPTYTVAFNVVRGIGSITAAVDGAPIASGASVDYGSEVVFTATAGEGYSIEQWTLNGDPLDNHSPDRFTVKDLDKNITVTVAFEAIPYTLDVAVLPAGAGMVTLNPNTAFFTTGQVISLSASPNTGFDFLHWLDNGKSILSTDNPFDYTMPAHNTSLNAVFTVSQYTITATAGTNGSINPAGDVVVDHGDNQSFTITPNTGYHIVDVLVNGGSVGALSSYTFENVTQSHTIQAIFSIDTYTIAASAGPNGSIAPEGEVTVNEGSSQRFTITPNTGYHIADVLVNGSSVGTPTEYTFTNVTDDHTIHTTFAINTYTITASASPAAGGTVSGAGTYTHGEEVILTATANEEYEFVNWTENGTVVSSSAEYIFDASDNHSLLAVFKLSTLSQQFTLTVNTIGNGKVKVDGTTYTDPIAINGGETVSLLAEADSSWQFDGWTGDLTSNEATTEIFIDGDKVVTASFSEIPIKTYSLTFIVEKEDSTPIPDATIEFEGEVFPAGNYIYSDLLPGDYSYLVMKDGFHSSSSVVTIVDKDINEMVVLSRDDVHVPNTLKTNFLVYPNPARGLIYVTSDKYFTALQLLNIHGKSIVQHSFPNSLNHFQLDTKQMEAGIYFLRVFTTHGIITEKIQILE